MWSSPRTASTSSPLHRPPWCLVQGNEVHGFLCLENRALSPTWQSRAFCSFLQDARQANLLGCKWDEASDSTASDINSLLMIFITRIIVLAVDIFIWLFPDMLWNIWTPSHPLGCLPFSSLYLLPLLESLCFLASFHVSLNFNCKNYIHCSHLRVK